MDRAVAGVAMAIAVAGTEKRHGDAISYLRMPMCLSKKCSNVRVVFC